MPTRHDTRETSSYSCKINVSGSIHECRLENISASGARVNCLGFLKETSPGDQCTLHFGDGRDDITCHVTNITASHIGLKFVDIGGTPDQAVPSSR